MRNSDAFSDAAPVSGNQARGRARVRAGAAADAHRESVPTVMKTKPAYAIASVDSALRLALVLRQEGPMRLIDAAARLGVSVSTAHRLLGMLVYWDFAEQLPDRSYGPGPVLPPPGDAAGQPPVARLLQVAAPQLRRLADELGETANLMVLAGTDVYFVATVQCSRVPRIGDRTGRTLPAYRASGGKAILATLGERRLDAALTGLDGEAVARVRRELWTIRRRGFAVNDQETEIGLTAVGVAVPDHLGVTRAAISVAAPRTRFSAAGLTRWAGLLRAVVAEMADDLHPAPPSPDSLPGLPDTAGDRRTR